MPQNNNNVKKKISLKREKILDFDKKTGLLIPIKWKHPYLYRKKDFLAIIIGLNTRYEFERIFCDKAEFEIDENDQRIIGIGFDKSYFTDDLILEEKYSYKENNTFIQKTNYYKISMDIDGIYGVKISKSNIKEHLSIKQQQIYDELKTIMKLYGEEFTLYTMRSILNQKKRLSDKINLFFVK
jgi:hypothetical protein